MEFKVLTQVMLGSRIVACVWVGVWELEVCLRMKLLGSELLGRYYYTRDRWVGGQCWHPRNIPKDLGWLSLPAFLSPHPNNAAILCMGTQ